MAEVLRPRRVLGLDQSTSFVSMVPPAGEVEGSIAWELRQLAFWRPRRLAG